MKRLYFFGLLWLVAAGCADNTVISEGDRVGVVTKLSHKQLCRNGAWSWEGELSTQGGTNAAGQGAVDENGNRQAVGVWQFSVASGADSSANPVVVDQLREAMNTGHTVRVSYRQVRLHNDCESGSDYFVTVVADLSHQ